MSTKKVSSLKNSSNLPISEVLQTILEQKKWGSFLIRGNREIIIEQINHSHSYNESIVLEVTTLGIDDVRKKISQTDFATKDDRLVVLSFYNITLEAQNALLKFLEEPPTNTTILLVTEDSTVVLPTVQSRVTEYVHEAVSATNESVELFLSTEPAYRMELGFVKKMLAQKNEEDVIDKEKIHAFISAVLQRYGKTEVTKLTSLEREMLQNSIVLVSRFKQSGSSPKQILEYISLALYKI